MTVDQPVECDVAIVGAGIAGLCAAATLMEAGRRVVVVDKSRGVGGRMATRRLGHAVVDHGAQFFTVRGELFDVIVANARHHGAIVPWCLGFARAESVDQPAAPADDGHPRYRGVQGMTDLPKLLAAGLVGPRAALRTNARVTAIAIADGRVRLAIDGGGDLFAHGCVVTPPVPQALDLFAAGGLLAPATERIAVDTHRLLASIAYDPCFALMLVLDGPSRVPPPGGVQFESGPIAWLADNQQKGISPVPALTVHASGEFSRARFDDPPDDVVKALRAAAAPWIGAATVVEQSLQRWKYALPTTVLDVPFVGATTSPPIVCCGDAFAGPKVEGAATSGTAAGRWLAGVLGPA
ncbi:MAG: FAD-dependent oxidoreductase [Planctomycetia bacterium]